MREKDSPEMMPRAVICDIDGTLVWEKQKLPSARVLRALEQIHARGVLVIAATGRIRQLIPDGLLRLADYCVCGNGGLVTDQAGQVLQETPFDRDLVEELTAFSDRTGAALSFSFPSGYGAYRDFPAIRRLYLSCAEGELSISDETATRTRHLREAPFSAFLIGNEGRIYEYLRRQHRIQAARQWEGHFDVYPVATTKAAGISGLLLSRGIRWKEVVAFGDSPNDLEMLAAAGRGYAMGNACPEAKQIAQFEAPPVWEDGVAQVLEQLFDLD